MEEAKSVEEAAAPAEEPAETAPEEPAEESMEPMEPMEPPPQPKTVRMRRNAQPRRPRANADVVLPEVNDRFWADLLRTQRDAERATRLQRMADFNLL